jgi:muconolactone D-isomerase
MLPGGYNRFGSISMEFLVQIQVNFPPEMPAEELERVSAAEVVRGRELQAAGTIVRIWRIPGRRANVGIWAGETADDIHAAIMSLPAFPWLDVRVTALATHHLEAAG